MFQFYGISRRLDTIGSFFSIISSVSCINFTRYLVEIPGQFRKYKRNS
jgi:hypothetical protein